MINRREIKNLFIKKIKSGELKDITLYGSSMLPTIVSGSRLEISTTHDIKVGDIVVANRESSNVLVIHRVVEIDQNKDKIILLGDNQTASEKECFRREDIIAKVIKVHSPMVDTNNINLVIDIPFGSPKFFNEKSYQIYQSLINKNKETYFFDLNIDFNLSIYGEDKVKKLKEKFDSRSAIDSLYKYMNLIREIKRREYNIFRFTFSKLALCDTRDDLEIKNLIENYRSTIYYNFYKSKMLKLKAFVKEKGISFENTNIYISVDNFDRLLSAVIFAEILSEEMNILPILVDNSTLFFDRFDTRFFEKYFKKIIPAHILNSDFHSLSTSYDAIDFDRYITHYRVAPINIRSECYYKKCLFCDRHSNDNFSFPIENIYNKIVALDRADVHNIVFQDDCLIPNDMVRLLGRLKESHTQIKWQGIFRFDPALNHEEIIQFFSENGCRFLFFGLESFSQAHLDRMNKGIKIENALSILSLCKKYKIATSVSFLFNFPGETLDDLRLTFENIKKYIDLIDNFEFNFFTPTKNCKLDIRDRGINYFTEADEMPEPKKKIIQDILSFVKNKNKNDSFYLKNYYCWAN